MLMGMFVARGIEPSEIEVENKITDASVTGRGYAVDGRVAHAVVERIHELKPDLEVKTECGDGLAECVKMMKLAKASPFLSPADNNNICRIKS